MSKAEISDDIIKQIDDILVEEMTKERSPGLSIGIVSDNKLIFTRNYGAKNLEQNQPTNSDTLYMIASVTKSFVCCGILKLVEEGKLSLDDPISKYVPIHLGFNDDPIRVKHLMSHISGIPDLTDPLWDKNREEIFGLTFEIPKIPFTSWDDIYRHLNGATEYISERPGRRFYYNNMAYQLIAEIIGTVSGMPFDKYIEKEILSPLEMNSSSFDVEKVERDANLATPYILSPDSKIGKLIAYHYPKRMFVSAAGGLFSSINDMANYAIMQLNEGNFQGKQILTKEHIVAMQTIQMIEEYPNLPFSSIYGDYGKTGYGFGLAIHSDFFGYKLIEHSGSYSGASAWFALLPEKKYGVIFLSNKHPSPRMFAQVVLMILLGIDTNEHPLIRLRNHHKQLIGEYVTYKSVLKVQVVSSAGGLFLKFNDPNFPTQQLIPYNPDNYNSTLNYYIFTEIGGKEPIQFEIDKDGIVWFHLERQKWKKVRDLE